MANTTTATAAPPTPGDLVREHLTLVQHVVNQLTARYPAHVDRNDLWSAGALGLVDAAGRYDPAKAIPFPRYASIRIRGAIIDANRDRDWAPRSLRRHARQVHAAVEGLEAQHGRNPSDGEVAASLGLDAEELRARQADLAQARVLELDRDSDDETGATLADAVCEVHEDFLPEEALERRELVGALRMAVTMLPETHREPVERYYFGGELLRDIASDHAVTEARISQLCLEAVQAIRAYFATVFDGVPPVAETAPGRSRRERYVATMLEETTWRDRLAAASA
jgi:RNA polymerase sigma factor FliA